MYVKEVLFQRIASIKNVTNKELAISIGVSGGNITDWKQGRSRPNIDAIIKIADFLNCSIDYLLGRADVPEINN